MKRESIRRILAFWPVGRCSSAVGQQSYGRRAIRASDVRVRQGEARRTAYKPALLLRRRLDGGVDLAPVRIGEIRQCAQTRGGIL